MKILLVSQYYYPERFKVTELAEELFRRGIEIDVLTGLPNYPDGVIPNEYRYGRNRNQIINGVRVIRVPLVTRRKGNFFRSLNYISFAINASIRAMFLHKEYDAILVYQLSPILMAIPAIVVKRIQKIPFIMYTFDLWPDSISAIGIKQVSMFYKFVRLMSRWIYRQADAQWVSSALFSSYLDRFTGKNIDIIHLPQYAEDQFIIQQKEDDEDFVCLFAGNMGKAQSIDTILLAAKRLECFPNIHFELVGSGSDYDRLIGLAKELELSNVHFAGDFPLSEMPKFYTKADIFLVTLFSNPIVSLTLPGKVQTYLSAGKPIVGAASGETEAVIRESHCGICVASGDHDGMADAILYYYRNRDQVRVDGENGRDYYMKNFHKEQFYDRIMEQLNSVVQGGK